MRFLLVLCYWYYLNCTGFTLDWIYYWYYLGFIIDSTYLGFIIGTTYLGFIIGTTLDLLLVLPWIYYWYYLGFIVGTTLDLLLVLPNLDWIVTLKKNGEVSSTDHRNLNFYVNIKYMPMGGLQLTAMHA